MNIDARGRKSYITWHLEAPNGKGICGSWGGETTTSKQYVTCKKCLKLMGNENE